MNSFLPDQNFKQISKLSVLGLSLGIVSILSQSAIANDYVGNRGIQFQEDTIIEFEFLKSHGAYQSSFGVVDLETCQVGSRNEILFDSCAKTPLLSEVKPSDSYASVERNSTREDDFNRVNLDFEGTPGNTVPEPIAEFNFKRGRRYALYLESNFNGRNAGTVYSLDLINPESRRQALFRQGTRNVVNTGSILTEEVNAFDSLSNENGGLILRFDDTGSNLVKERNQDMDFDDFVIGIGGYEDCGCSY